MSCYVIAEAGVAHEGSLADATHLLDTATEAGADAFKIQYFERGMKRRDGSDMPWLQPEEVITLSRDCRERGLDFIITPHDGWALDFIISKRVCDKIKIGSGDWHVLRIYNGTRTTKLPLIISTGMHTDGEIDRMVHSQCLGSYPASILHCISAYPTLPTDSKLWYMKQMINRYPGVVIGYSDHTIGTAIPLAAVASGAQIIEKHISIDEDMPGRPDTYVSLRHDMFIKFVAAIRGIEESLMEPSARQLTPEEHQTKHWVMQSRGLTLDTWR